jgi:hypothetical protein
VTRRCATRRLIYDLVEKDLRTRRRGETSVNDSAPRIEIQIGPLRLAVLGWAYPGAQTDWDADRLIVEAVCIGAGSRVEAGGDIMPALSFRRFSAALKQIASTLTGDARLETHNPDLKVAVRMSDGLGHLDGDVEISSDYDRERHTFKFSGLDQTDLPRLIAEISNVTSMYPSAIGTRDGI